MYVPTLQSLLIIMSSSQQWAKAFPISNLLIFLLHPFPPATKCISAQLLWMPTRPAIPSTQPAVSNSSATTMTSGWSARKPIRNLRIKPLPLNLESAKTSLTLNALIARRKGISRLNVGPKEECYILTLPLLFLTPPHPFIHLPIKPPTPGTVLPLSPTSLTPFPLTPLISSLIFPLNLSILLHCYTLGHIPLTASLSSALIILMGTPQSFGLWPGPTRLTSIHWNTLPSVMSVSALLTTLMVVTYKLSSYLLILSYPSSPWISYRSSLIVPLVF